MGIWKSGIPKNPKMPITNSKFRGAQNVDKDWTTRKIRLVSFHATSSHLLHGPEKSESPIIFARFP